MREFTTGIPKDPEVFGVDFIRRTKKNRVEFISQSI